MATPKRKEQKVLDPIWFRNIAKIAMKRGTSIIFSNDRQVYGISPKSGGSVMIRYPASEEWIDAVLEMCPKGAVFPHDDIFGGPAVAKAVRPYANITLPDEGGAAYIHPTTAVLHMKGTTVKIHSAGFAAHDSVLGPQPDDFEPLKFDTCVPKDIGKLIVECTRRDDNRPTLRRVYGIQINDDRFIGATDGRSAILHKCDCVPVGFSYDPALVNLYDIAGYCREKDEEGNSVTHHYQMVDGTIISEKLSDAELPKIGLAISTALNGEKTKMVGSLGLSILMEEVATLGLGALDAWGGILDIKREGISMLVDGQPVADFTIQVDEVVGDRIFFALPLLARMAKLGADVYVLDKGSPALVSTGTTHFVGMPAQLNVKEPATR